MRYFGPPADAPIYEDIAQTEGPFGELCLYPMCELPIDNGQRGFILMDLTTGQEYPIHRRCLLEWVIGPDLTAEIAKSGTFLDDGGP